MNSIIHQQVDRQYEEFKTELAICRIGGLFLALYDDERIPQIIIARLKKDLPNYFQHTIGMTEQKIWFPILFSQTYEPIGKQNTIFHVLGIKQLERSKEEDFIKYLQYGRERFKVKPYSIVFWVYPSFVRRLFISAPDFHHWIAGIYDFTKMKHQSREDLSNFAEENESDSLEKIDNCLKKTIWQYFHHWIAGIYDFTKMKHQSREYLSDSTEESESDPLEKIDNYLKKAIWQYEHWDDVKNNGGKFLIEAMGRANLDKYYVES